MRLEDLNLFISSIANYLKRGQGRLPLEKMIGLLYGRFDYGSAEVSDKYLNMISTYVLCTLTHGPCRSADWAVCRSTLQQIHPWLSDDSIRKYEGEQEKKRVLCLGLGHRTDTESLMNLILTLLRLYDWRSLHTYNVILVRCPSVIIHLLC